MIDFILKQIPDTPLYNLTFMKEVHKRSGEVVKESGTTLYTISLDWAKNKIAHMETEVRLGDVDISLQDYMSEFHKSYNDICELLKKTL